MCLITPLSLGNQTKDEAGGEPAEVAKAAVAAVDGGPELTEERGPETAVDKEGTWVDPKWAEGPKGNLSEPKQRLSLGPWRWTLPSLRCN